MSAPFPHSLPHFDAKAHITVYFWSDNEVVMYTIANPHAMHWWREFVLLHKNQPCCVSSAFIKINWCGVHALRDHQVPQRFREVLHVYQLLGAS